MTIRLVPLAQSAQPAFSVWLAGSAGRTFISGVTMSSINKPSSGQVSANQDDEVGDAALDSVSGGQGNEPIQKLDTMVVTAKRIPPSTAAVQKLDPIVVTATRLPPDLNGTQVASANIQGKKGT
jgi:hypothetical protein